MTTVRIRRAGATLAIVLMIACNAGQPAIPPDAPGTIPGSETRALAARLERDGAHMSFVDATPSSPGFHVASARYALNGADVHVIEYPSLDRAETQAGLIAPDGFRIGSTIVQWQDKPHFYLQGRLILYYVGSDPQILGLLAKAVGPQFAGR